MKVNRNDTRIHMLYDLISLLNTNNSFAKMYDENQCFRIRKTQQSFPNSTKALDDSGSHIHVFPFVYVFFSCSVPAIEENNKHLWTLRIIYLFSLFFFRFCFCFFYISLSLLLFSFTCFFSFTPISEISRRICKRRHF